MESDSGIGEEALADHPSQWDTSEVVSGIVRNGTSTNV